MTYRRMKPADRKACILTAAITEARRLGYNKFRLVDVAKAAACSTASVMHYWTTMEQVRRDVMRAAIKDEILEIVAVGIALDDPRCRKLSIDLRERAKASL